MRLFRRMSASGERETALSRLSRLQASYRSRVRAVWLAIGATAVMTVLLALWMIPWVPVGMARDDYSFEVWVALVLAMGSAVMALLAFLAREPASGEREAVDIWHRLMGGAIRLRGRHQFRNRLARECERARRDRRTSLSLILVSVGQEGDHPDPGSPDAIEHVVNALATTVRSSDVMGIVEAAEIGVLVIGAGARVREVICRRLERALTAALRGWTEAGLSSGTPRASLGASTFGADGVEPGHLLAAARASLAPVIPRRKKAA